jgi:hypothetical protein
VEEKKWTVDKARHKYKDNIKNGSNKSEDGEK